MSTHPFYKLSREPLPDPCRCLGCGGSCGRRVPKKWFQCNSCSKGFHGLSCPSFVPNRFPHIVPECDECGLLEAEH